MLILPGAPALAPSSEDKFFAHFFHFHFPAPHTVLENHQKSLIFTTFEFSRQKSPKYRALKSFCGMRGAWGVN